MKWDNTTNIKLNGIKQTVSKQYHVPAKRKESSCFDPPTYRAYSHHSFIYWKNDKRSDCIPCQNCHTIKPILIDSMDLFDSRNKLYNEKGIKILFEMVPSEQILSFLKEVKLYKKK